MTGETTLTPAPGELPGPMKPNAVSRRNRRAIHVASVFVLALGFAVAASGAPPSPQGGPPFVTEAHVTAKRLAAMVAGGSLSLPQLRLYDGRGRLVFDFGTGFSAEAFPGQLDEVLRHPVPRPGASRTLARDLAGAVDARGEALEPPKGAGLVFVEYWADWCAPCHAQFKSLVAYLEAHRDVGAALLHIDLAGPSATQGAEPPH